MHTFEEHNFDDIQNKINQFLKDQKDNFYDIHEPKEKLPISDSIFCAEDAVRNKAFWEATGDVIAQLKQKKNNLVVVDAGAGTGILGAFALLQGAKKCYFLEQNHHSLALARRLITFLGLTHFAEFIHCDATSYDGLPESYDLLISETLSSGFVQEDFPFIINNLKQFGAPHAKIIPQGFQLEVEEYNGERMPTGQQNIEISSKDLEKAKQLKLLDPSNTKFLRFAMHANLTDGRMLKSGSCISFLNERYRSLEQQHPFFELS